MPAPSTQTADEDLFAPSMSTGEALRACFATILSLLASFRPMRWVGFVLLITISSVTAFHTVLSVAEQWVNKEEVISTMEFLTDRESASDPMTPNPSFFSAFVSLSLPDAIIPPAHPSAQPIVSSVAIAWASAEEVEISPDVIPPVHLSERWREIKSESIAKLYGSQLAERFAVFRWGLAVALILWLFMAYLISAANTVIYVAVQEPGKGYIKILQQYSRYIAVFFRFIVIALPLSMVICVIVLTSILVLPVLGMAYFEYYPGRFMSIVLFFAVLGLFLMPFSLTSVFFNMVLGSIIREKRKAWEACRISLTRLGENFILFRTAYKVLLVTVTTTFLLYLGTYIIITLLSTAASFTQTPDPETIFYLAVAAALIPWLMQMFQKLTAVHLVSDAFPPLRAPQHVPVPAEEDAAIRVPLHMPAIARTSSGSNASKRRILGSRPNQPPEFPPPPA